MTYIEKPRFGHEAMADLSVIVYHIRRPLKKTARPHYRNPGNVDRYNGTYCGSEPTGFDITRRDKTESALEGFECCPECIRIMKGETE